MWWRAENAGSNRSSRSSSSLLSQWRPVLLHFAGCGLGGRRAGPSSLPSHVTASHARHIPRVRCCYCSRSYMPYSTLVFIGPPARMKHWRHNLHTIAARPEWLLLLLNELHTLTASTAAVVVTAAAEDSHLHQYSLILLLKHSHVISCLLFYKVLWSYIGLSRQPHRFWC